MPIFFVEGYESISTTAYVEADNEDEALEKVQHGDVIEGTQESEPGKMIWPTRWRVSEGEAVLWDGRGFGRHTTYRQKV